MSIRLSRLGLAASAAAALSFAPIAAEAQARFGVLVGTSVTTIDNVVPLGVDEVADAFKQKSRAGLQLGAYLQLPLAGSVSLQPELHYIQKGTKFELSDVEIGTSEIGFKLAYVEVPVLLRFDLGSGNVRPFIVAGPSAALRASCKVSFSFGGFGGDTDCDDAESIDDGEEVPGEPAEPIDDPFKKLDFGGIVGAGIQGSFGGRAVSAQLRYSRGFTNIAKETIPGVTPRNSGFSVVFGLGF